MTIICGGTGWARGPMRPRASAASIMVSGEGDGHGGHGPEGAAQVRRAAFGDLSPRSLVLAGLVQR
jgi:hypothetical protein